MLGKLLLVETLAFVTRPLQKQITEWIWISGNNSVHLIGMNMRKMFFWNGAQIYMMII